MTEYQHDNEIVETSQTDDEAVASEARQKLVSRITQDIKDAKKHFEKDFRRMREDMDLVWKGHTEDDDMFVDEDDDLMDDPEVYSANLVIRHIQQRTAALYAKNPRAVARRRERKMFMLFDGNPQTLAGAQAVVAGGAQGLVPDPVALKQSEAILRDYQQGTEAQKKLDSIADSLVFLFHYALAEQVPNVKAQMKQLVRRTLTTGVGFLKLGFQREYGTNLDVEARIADVTDQLEYIDRLVDGIQNNEFDAHSARAEELRLALMELEQKKEILVREGILFSFPPSTTIIVDTKVRSLRGFVGADWVAQEYCMTGEEIRKQFKVNVGGGEDGSNFTQYSEDSRKTAAPQHIVWEYYHRPTGLVYTVADGHKNFLKEPEAPAVEVEQFFPYFTLMFTEIEHEDQVYPPSDARLMRSQQREYNSTRQAFVEHRRASAPQYAATDAVEDDDMDNIVAGIPHTIAKIKSLPQGTKVADVIGQIPKAPIDQNFYSTNSIMEDVFLTVGAQEADFGGTSGATATEAGIAASSRSTSLGSNVDDLDDFMTDIARASGQIFLREMSVETVKEIVGPGAVWGVLTNDEIAKEVFLEIEAGSSGRPNKAEDIATLERVTPLLLQLPDIDPTELTREVLRRFDDKLDLDRLVKSGNPSITALNANIQPGNGDPINDPNLQGPQGANNDPTGPEPQPGPEGLNPSSFA